MQFYKFEGIITNPDWTEEMIRDIFCVKGREKSA